MAGLKQRGGLGRKTFLAVLRVSCGCVAGVAGEGTNMYCKQSEAVVELWTKRVQLRGNLQ